MHGSIGQNINSVAVFDVRHLSPQLWRYLWTNLHQIWNSFYVWCNKKVFWAGWLEAASAHAWSKSDWCT